MSFTHPFAYIRATFFKIFLLAIGLVTSLLLPNMATATTVQIQTVLGDFEVNLFDRATPKTVANFVAYVNAGAYTNSIIHRSVKDFVIQGGGYKYTGTIPAVAIPQNAKVENEPVYSNLRGTIAMAKLGSDANSATNQWFINLSNNSANLDKQNGGFTVFGQVTGNGMAVVDAIAGLNRFNLGGAFDVAPLRKYTTTDASNQLPVTGDHLMIVTGVVVLNASPDTAASLSPVKNTLIDEKDNTGRDGGGGSLGALGLLMLGLLALGRKTLLNSR